MTRHRHSRCAALLGLAALAACFNPGSGSDEATDADSTSAGSGGGAAESSGAPEPTSTSGPASTGTTGAADETTVGDDTTTEGGCPPAVYDESLYDQACYG